MLGFQNKAKRYKYVGELRKSKITTTSGVGALVDFPGFSGIMGGLHLWKKPTEDMRIYDKRLESLCNKSYFVQAVDAGKFPENTKKYRIPVIRFPEYYYCPRCHELDYAKKISKNLSNDKIKVEPLICNNCETKTELLPSRFVISCNCGHISDFPYEWWAHKKAGGRCEKPRLKMIIDPNRSGLESIRIQCACGASNTMANCLNKEALAGLTCRGDSPWLGKGYKEECGRELRALMRGSNNVYYPITVNALTIPPWSNEINRVIDEDINFYKGLVTSGLDINTLRVAVKGFFDNKGIAKQYNCSYDEFFHQFCERFDITDGKTPAAPNVGTENDLIKDEYKAFIGEDKDDPYFKLENVEVPSVLSDHIKSVKLVKRLREIQVLRAFRRIDMYSEGESEETPVFAKLSKFPQEWLPAVEMLGEGIFIEFSKEKILEWKQKDLNRYNDLKTRYNNKKCASMYGKFSDTKVLLHTLSHLLMRELAFESGYDASSIKEKLYVDEEDWMSGILIYTASSSSDGSLGGLVRQGQTDKFINIVESAVTKAFWCSNDPVCLESHGQGVNSLNLAACYACSLVPETSCAYNNTLLDRQAVIGSFDNPNLGFFSDILSDDDSEPEEPAYIEPEATEQPTQRKKREWDF